MTPVMAQILFTVVAALFGAIVYILGFLMGSRTTERRYGEHMGRVLNGLRAEIRDRDDDEGDVRRLLVHMSDAVLTACRALDVEAMRAEISLQMGLLPEDNPPEEVALATMHMMRAQHVKFTKAEREWSRAWLAKNHPGDGEWVLKGPAGRTIN